MDSRETKGIGMQFDFIPRVLDEDTRYDVIIEC